MRSVFGGQARRSFPPILDREQIAVVGWVVRSGSISLASREGERRRVGECGAIDGNEHRGRSIPDYHYHKYYEKKREAKKKLEEEEDSGGKQKYRALTPSLLWKQAHVSVR